MFQIDQWQEIFATLRANKVRTLMTGIGVFWGVLMLVVMLGVGRGLEQGVTTSMKGFATNSVYLWANRTSEPYMGMRPGRYLRFERDDIEALRVGVPEIEHLAPRNQLGGWRNGENVVRDGKTGSFFVSADYPAFRHIQPAIFEAGRFINDLDMRDGRKVAVIGAGVREQLYDPDEPVIGSYLKIQGVYFQVVGLFRSQQSGEEGDRQNNTVHVPFATYQHAFNVPYVGWFAFTAAAEVRASTVEEKVRTLLGKRHLVAPTDKQAIGSYNAENDFRKVSNMFTGVSGLIWFVGVVTLLAGIIGVSNIMLIVVRERTREIGIRKALGATPFSIVYQLLQESTALTAVAGYLGLLAGIALLEFAGPLLPDDSGMLAPPSIDLEIGIAAAGILVLTGMISGLIPARAAVRIHPVDAFRAE